MKKVFLALAFIAATGSVFAQKKTTSSATVSFDASTPKDELPKAENKTAIASLNTKTGAIAFEAPVKNFVFPNATIQEHFNGEKWLNSDKYKTFTFKGKLANPSSIDFSKDGTYSGTVEGDLTVKDKTSKVSTPATFTVKGGTISGTASFTIKLSDYGITSPAIDGGKVANDTKVNVSADFK